MAWNTIAKAKVFRGPCSRAGSRQTFRLKEMRGVRFESKVAREKVQGHHKRRAELGMQEGENLIIRALSAKVDVGFL